MRESLNSLSSSARAEKPRSRKMPHVPLPENLKIFRLSGGGRGGHGVIIGNQDFKISKTHQHSAEDEDKISVENSLFASICVAGFVPNK